KPPGVPLQSVPILELLLMPICGLLGWKIAERFRLFGASILGPMILTAIVSLSGLIHTRPPAEILWCAQFFIGISVGVHYSGITLAELRRDIYLLESSTA
ncbi:MAG: AbrB family transcriptional regulator, partial [SAR324 cluster bacterium]|nr:AbrB family transcriptional regulator [SAR324 cluster bacterium]